MNWSWKLVSLLLGAALLTWIFYRPAHRAEISIATVNNADMILMQQLSSEFENQTGIKVNWVVLGENVLRQRLTVDIATGSNTFDVITIGSYEAPLWGERGWVLPLDDLGADYGYDDIFNVVREGLSYHGRMYALPFYSESSFTYYRKDLFEKAGLQMPNQPSYEQIRQFAQKLHDPNHSVYGICLRGEPGWGENVAYLSTLVDTFGGRWFDLNWTPATYKSCVDRSHKFLCEFIEELRSSGSDDRRLQREPRPLREWKLRHVDRRNFRCRIFSGPRSKSSGDDHRFCESPNRESPQRRRVGLELGTGDSRHVKTY